MRIGITGATGVIGRAVGALAAGHGHEVVAFTRDPARAKLAFAAEVRPIDSRAPQPLDASELDVLLHLAGESIMGLWTEAKKKRIRDSRIEFTQRLVRCLATTNPRPTTLLSASAIGIYGDRGDELLDEASAPGNDFLASVCKDWEASASRAKQLGVRVVHLRTGLVLANEGGAFKLMRTAFQWGLGGRFGDGSQWMSWIHVLDEARLILWAAERQDFQGQINLVAPQPVTNAEFTRVLAKALHRPAFMHVPAFALRTAMGEASTMLLGGQRVEPNLALAHGFQFDCPTLDSALTALIAH